MNEAMNHIPKQAITVEQSGAFIERFTLPPTSAGPLDGLRFAVKDLIDVAGHRTGCGNPTWLTTYPPADVSAVCVEQLLASGATCDGKVITDELASSLLGENHFYGTPLNPAAPDRVPGGSSSGSASAVACGLVDFALGTDTGGSVRIPANNCGIWGWRPTHGIVSVAGVMPLAPTLDTVGILARNGEILERTAAALMASEPATSANPNVIHLVTESFAQSDAEVRDALQESLSRLREQFGDRVRETSLVELCDDPQAADPVTWHDTYRILQRSEARCCYGSWIAHVRPELGPAMMANFAMTKKLDRTRIKEGIQRREHYFRRLRGAIGPRDLLCLPTAPTIPPKKGSILPDTGAEYFGRVLALTTISGAGRLPQVTIPLATASTAPVGLSLIGGQYEDAFTLRVACVVSGE